MPANFYARYVPPGPSGATLAVPGDLENDRGNDQGQEQEVSPSPRSGKKRKTSTSVGGSDQDPASRESRFERDGGGDGDGDGDGLGDENVKKRKRKRKHRPDGDHDEDVLEPGLRSPLQDVDVDVMEDEAGLEVEKGKKTKKRDHSTKNNEDIPGSGKDLISESIEDALAGKNSKKLKKRKSKGGDVGGIIEPKEHQNPDPAAIEDELDLLQKTVKKMKKQESNVNDAEAITESETSTQNPHKVKETSDLTRKQIKRLKKQKSNAAIIDAAVDESEDKHKSMRAKFKKASTKSEQPTEDNEVEDDSYALEKVEPIGIQPLPQPKRVHDEPRSTISALPDWLAHPIQVKADEIAPFSKFELDMEIVQRLTKSGFDQAFAIQTVVLPMLLPGSNQHRGDTCVSAATGSGKTLAYTLPIIEALKDKPITRLRALIVVPTRELVTQVREVFRVTGSSIKVGTAVGSKSLSEEREALIDVDEVYDPEAYRKHIQDLESVMRWQVVSIKDRDIASTRNYILQRSSKVDVLICTPGRLVDHIQSTKGFTLKHLQWLVIDEADRLLDQSFQQWIDVVMPELERKPEAQSPTWRSLKPRSRLRKVILSATMTRDYSKLIALNLFNPRLVVVEAVEQSGDPSVETALMSIPDRLEEIAIPVKEAMEKPLYLVQLLEAEPGTNNTTTAQPRDMDISSASDSDSDISSLLSELELDDASNNVRSDSDRESSPITRPFTHQQTRPVPKEPNHGHLIFTTTNESALRLTRLLTLLRPQWSTRLATLTKSTGTSSTRKALTAFRGNKIDIIIATDLASRGLDLQNLGHVVNYDIPKSLTTYIHRVGRTARAGRNGVATTLISHHEARWFWSEIGKSKDIDRGGKAIKRNKMQLVVTDHDREVYESALLKLGQEVKESL